MNGRREIDRWSPLASFSFLSTLPEVASNDRWQRARNDRGYFPRYLPHRNHLCLSLLLDDTRRLCGECLTIRRKRGSTFALSTRVLRVPCRTHTRGDFHSAGEDLSSRVKRKIPECPPCVRTRSTLVLPRYLPGIAVPAPCTRNFLFFFQSSFFFQHLPKVPSEDSRFSRFSSLCRRFRC